MVKIIHNKSLYLLILAGLFLPASNVFADGNDVDFSITVGQSLTLSLSSNAVNFTITPDADGEFNSANFTVTSATNNPTGYTLLMTTSNTNLTSNTINPVTTEYPTIPTLTETQAGISAADFAASTDSGILNHYGVAIGGGNYNAMKAEKTIKETDENNTSGTDTTTINLASKLDLLTVPGTYSTTFNFQMTANADNSFVVLFNNNGGEGAISASSIERGDIITLSKGNLTKTGYVFAGWNTRADGEGNWYRENKQYKAPAANEIVNNNVTLYAQWRLPCNSSATSIDDAVCMQDINSAVKSSMVTEQQYSLYDSRDGAKYYIVKMTDDRVWMAQNLDLDLIHMENDEDALYTHDNTDLGWGGGSYSIQTWNPTRSTIDSVAISTGGTAADWVNSETQPYSLDAGNWYYNHTGCTGSGYDIMTNCNYLSEDKSNTFSRSPDTIDGRRDHVGNYYNWTAAIAKNDTSTTEYQDGGKCTKNKYFDERCNVPDSICPAGWRLPKYIKGGEDAELLDDYTETDFRNQYLTVPGFDIRSGYFLINSLSGAGVGPLSRYLLQTASFNEDNRYFGIRDYMFKLGLGVGFPVRCIAR